MQLIERQIAHVTFAGRVFWATWGDKDVRF